jgi:hypothetical protein
MADREWSEEGAGSSGITFELLLEEDLRGDGGGEGENEHHRDGPRCDSTDRHPSDGNF